MRTLILHIGHPKTGTTALQTVLSKSRDRLLSHGLFYPESQLIPHNHTDLVPWLLGYERTSFHVRSKMGETEAAVLTNSKAAWDDLQVAAGDKKFDHVILSSEMLYQKITKDTAQKIRDMKSKLGISKIRILAYIRDPADRYLSTCQQRLKTRQRIMRLKTVPNLPILDSYRRYFGAALDVRVYDRAEFQNASIAQDFFEWLGRPSVLDKKDNITESNVSISAEAMWVLSRIELSQGESHIVDRQRRLKLFNLVNQIDRQIQNPTKPVLKEDKRDYIIRTSRELAILRKRYGLFFSNVDYAIVGSWTDDQPNFTQNLEDICVCNTARAQRIAGLVIEKLAEKPWGHDAKFRAMRPDQKPGNPGSF